jgi:hypothetical protein
VKIYHHYRVSRNLEVLCKTDIAVIGAGPSGCAAAITAAREGKKVLLIERYGFPGGAAVSQLVPVVLSQNCRDFQGIWFEWMDRMCEHGLAGNFLKGEQQEHWFSATYSPESSKHAWEQLMEESGVRVLYHCQVSDVIIHEGKIEALVLAARNGLYAVEAACFVDATGDGMVSHLAGEDFSVGDTHGPVAQSCTKMFRMVNSIKPSTVMDEEDILRLKKTFDRVLQEKKFDAPMITSGYILEYILGRAGKQIPDGTLLVNVTRMIDVNTLDPWNLSEAERLGRKYAKQCADFYINHVPGSEQAKLLETSVELGVRSSRRITCRYTLTIEDVKALRKFPDGIARGAWEIDVHSPRSYEYGRAFQDDPGLNEYRRRIIAGDFYEIPLGSLIPVKTYNLIVTGRCIDADVEAQGSARIQQTCMSTGEAAGLVSVFVVDKNISVQQVPGPEIRENLELIRTGIMKNVKTSYW